MRDAVGAGKVAFGGRKGARRPLIVLIEDKIGGENFLEAAVLAQLAVEARTQTDQRIAFVAAIDVRAPNARRYGN